MKRFHEHFSWLHRLGDQVIAHSDGSISCIVSIKGIDTSLKSDSELASAYNCVANVYKNLSARVLLEWHLWREYDDTQNRAYLEQHKKVVRGHALSEMVRTAMADHLRQFTVTNHVGLVVTLQPSRNPLKHYQRLTNHAFREKEQESMVPKLLKIAKGIAARLQGKIEPVEKFSEAIQRSSLRDNFYRGQNQTVPLSDRFQWNEQLVTAKPDYLEEKGVLKSGKTFTWVGIMKTPPETITARWPNWLMATIRGGRLGNGEIDVHLSYLTTPSSATRSVSKSDKEAKEAHNLRVSIGGAMNARRAEDAYGFAQDVAHHGMSVQSNLLVVHIHSNNLDRLLARVEEIKEQLSPSGALLVSNEEITWTYWRVGMPGQGHWNRFWRTHSEGFCAYMTPCIKFDQGSDQVTSLRMTRLGEAIGLHHKSSKASSAFIIGKTGVGKGAIKTLEIIETATLGTDWYIIELGPTHLSTVMALGGTYIKIDPSRHVINPFPAYADMLNSDASDDRTTSFIESFIRSISFTLVGRKGFDGLPDDLEAHYKAVAETALKDLYETDQRREGMLSPNLVDYMVALKTLSDPEITANPDQLDAAKKMASHLESFLSTASGRVFAGDNNLNFKPGVVGLDFSLLEGQIELADAMLAFTCSRIMTYAYFSKGDSRVLLEECSGFSSKDMIVTLADSIATMGRKNSCSVELSGQSYKQFQGFKEVPAQVVMRSCFFVQEEHQKVANDAQMPQSALESWAQYPHPDHITDDQPYRDMLLGYNQSWYELVLALPPIILDWVNTNGSEVLAAREKIAADMLSEAIEEYREKQRAQAALDGVPYVEESATLIQSKVNFELDPYEIIRRFKAWEATQEKPKDSPAAIVPRAQSVTEPTHEPELEMA